MSLSEVRALTFDVFGTVVNWRDSIAREAEALLGPKGHRLEWLRFAEDWRARYQPSMERVRTGQRPWVKLDVLHRENLVALLQELGISGLSEPEIDELNRAWHRLDPWPDSVAGLVRLKSKYVISPLSNGNFCLLVEMAKRAGLPWDCVISADLLGAYKPDPKTYLGAAKLLGLEPGEVMMVAAHGADLKAAGALGLRTAFVARPDEHGPGGPVEPTPENVDVATTSFLELASRLGC